MILKIITLSLVISYGAHAAPAIDDPQQILEKVRIFLGAPEFENAYQCQDTSLHEQNICEYDCERESCREVSCDTSMVQKSVTECSKDLAKITSVVSDEKEQITLTRQEFEKNHQNSFEMLINQLGQNVFAISSKDYVSLKEIQFIEYGLNQKKLSAIEVQLTFYFFLEGAQSYFKMPYIVTLARDVPLLSQTLKISTAFSNTKPFEKLISYSRKSP